MNNHFSYGLEGVKVIFTKKTYSPALKAALPNFHFSFFVDSTATRASIIHPDRSPCFPPQNLRILNEGRIPEFLIAAADDSSQQGRERHRHRLVADPFAQQPHQQPREVRDGSMRHGRFYSAIIQPTTACLHVDACANEFSDVVTS